MPESLRKKFVNPLKFADDIISTHAFQQNIRAMILKRVVRPNTITYC